MRGLTEQTCGRCADGWICEEHPDKPWPHDHCYGPGVPCENPLATSASFGLVWSAQAADAHRARSRHRHTA